MTRPWNERRNRQIFVMIERRKIPPKKVAFMLGMTVWGVYKIIHRFRSVQICPIETHEEEQKSA